MNQELPNEPEVEARLLSAIIQSPASIYNCLSLLNAECFYTQKYKNLWELIIELHNKKESFDLVGIASGLKDKNQLEAFGGFAGVADFTSKYFTHDVTGASRILHSKFIRRKAIVSNYELIRLAFDPMTDIETEISKAQNKLNEDISSHIDITSTAQDVSMDIAREISDNLGKYKEVTGVPTGFESYDKRISGLSTEGDIIIIAGRPAMGKTTFALNIAQNAQKIFGNNGAFFSLEMSKRQLCRILLAQQTGVSADSLKKNKVTDIEIEHIFNKLAEDPKAKLFIDDESPQLSYIVSKIHKLKRDEDIQFVVIDYMQLIACEAKNNREKEIEHISRTLKRVSKALEIAIIPLCQLSRAVENRGGSKVPQLSDLRDSGSIEQDASVVTFIYRPEYYGITQDEEGNSLEGVTVLVTKKNRFGEIGNDYLYFDKEMSEFFDYDHTTGNKVSADMYDMRLVTMQNMRVDTVSNFAQKIEDENKTENW